MTPRLTPKRRRRLLNPRNIRAWVGAFIRRDPAGAPVPLGLIADRFLDDTKSRLLGNEPGSMASLREGLAKAMRTVWNIKTGNDDIVHNVRLLEFSHRGAKAWFTIPSDTVLNTASGFIHKELCDAGTITAGSACLYGCTYCSVGASMFRSPQTRILRLLGIDHGDAVIRRLNPVAILRGQLTCGDGTSRFPDPNDRRVVIMSPIVDPLPTEDLLEEALEMIRLIHELTNWDVRVLTKSMLVTQLANRIPWEHRHRVVYGLSIGIVDDAMASRVERLTSLPSKRVEAYRRLQEQGLRTYSMHCPILPQASYTGYAGRLAETMNWHADEHVWAEPLNRRGDSNERTITALREAGFNIQAGLLAEATGSHTAWEFGYNRPLFEALAAVCPPGKLRYLVYAGDDDRDYWLSRRCSGAVVLRNEEPLDDWDDGEAQAPYHEHPLGSAGGKG